MPENQWASTLYESKHSFVWQYGADCIELLSPQPREYILDLGSFGAIERKIRLRL